MNEDGEPNFYNLFICNQAKFHVVENDLITKMVKLVKTQEELEKQNRTTMSPHIHLEKTRNLLVNLVYMQHGGF